MNELELLRNYKLQNPAKYLHKYGNVTPEEALKKLKPNKPFNLGGVKFEISEKKEKEMDFLEVKAPEVTVVSEQVASDAPKVPEASEAPKKTKKSKKVIEKNV